MMELPSRLRKGPLLVLSNDIIMFYALYLPEGTASNRSHRATGDTKALQYDEQAASFYWGLNIPVKALPYKQISDIQDHRRVCLKAIKDWAPEFHHMISIGESDSEKSNILVTKLRASTQPKSKWRAQVRSITNSEGHPRVWLLGDAIHAMQPNRGQGGNQALADCADMLPQLLHLNSLASIGHAYPTTEEISIACDKYEAAMMPRAFQWVKKSGGVSFPQINLDGIVGIIVQFVAKLVMPLLRLYYTLIPQRSEE
jgi:hypothetical protein